MKYGVITPKKQGLWVLMVGNLLVFSTISLVMTFCGPPGWSKPIPSRQAESSRDAVWNQWREDFPGYRPQTSRDTSLSSLARCLWKTRFFLMTFSRYLCFHNGTYPQRVSAFQLPSCFCSKWVCRRRLLNIKGACLGAWAHILWWVFLTMSSNFSKIRNMCQRQYRASST